MTDAGPERLLERATETENARSSSPTIGSDGLMKGLLMSRCSQSTMCNFAG